MHAIDIYNDENQQHLIKIASEVPDVLPRLEKINEISLEDKDDLSDSAFAWPEERLYPIYTKEAALLSSIYLEDAEDVPDYVKKNCEEACKAFGEDVEIGKIMKVASAPEELPLDVYVLPNRKKLPVVDQETYSRSESVFLNNLSEFDFDEAVVGARQLIKKASEYGVQPDDRLRQIGLTGQLNVEKAKEFSLERYSETGDEDYLSVADRLAGKSYSDIEKIAEWVVDIRALDEENNVKDRYSLFSAIEPIEKTAYLLIDNTEVPLEKVAQIDEDEWLEIMNEGTISYLFENGELDIEKLASLIEDSSDIEYDIISNFIRNKTRS